MKGKPVNVSNKVDWEIDPARSALLLQDLKGPHLAPLPARERAALHAEAERLARLCAARGMPVFICEMAPAGIGGAEGLMRDMWGNAASPGAPAPGLRLDGLAAHEVMRRGYSAFFGSDLEVMLRRLSRDSLLVAGLHTSIGCLSTAIDAFMRDIRPIMVADAMADFSPEEHEAGLRKAAQTCARVVEMSEIVAALAVPRRPQFAWTFDVC
nr:isochorismatase family protein [Afifella sp. IM 167]